MDWLTEIQTISGFSSWTDITPITKGWSEETKIRVQIPSGGRHLIRLTAIDNFERKKREFDAIKKLALTNLNISRPIDFGLTASGDFTYSIFTWVEGNDAEEEIPKLSSAEQYELGRRAGIMLREIHKIPAPPDSPSWGPKFAQKIEHRIEQYQKMDVRLDYDQRMIRYIRENLHFLNNRPQSLQHGDFHLGNMVLNSNPEKDDMELGLIDFNRLSYGDPWEEYERCYFTIQISIPFMNGQIHSYFNDDVPDLFFRLLTLYTGYSCIASLPWTIPFGPEEIDKMRIMSNSVIKMFNDFQEYIPKWYENPYIKRNKKRE